MRSDRDIRRTPRRPVRDPADEGNERPAASPFAQVPVSHRAPSGPPRDQRWDGRPPRDHRDAPRDAGWGDRPKGPAHGHRADDRRSRPPDDRPRRDDGRPRFGDERPRRDRPSGDRPMGDRPFGDRPRRPDRPMQGPTFDRARDERPRGDRPRDDRGRGDRPYGDRPQADRRPHDGPARPFADRLRGDRPFADPRPSREPRPAYTPNPEGQRLSKVLADRGLSSRREADDWIAAGWVLVDGEMAVLGQRVKDDARIEIDPAARAQQAQRVTILLHKPIGYVSGQAEDGYEPASVLVTGQNHWNEDPARKPFHAGHARGLAPAGRLDIDSTGLLVLTQDGRIAKHLIGEDSEVEKEYLVRVEPLSAAPLSEDALALLNHGLELDGVKLKPAKVSWANEDQLRFVLREGRKRQIRRMCELVGLKVLALKRVRIGSVVLGKLPVGQWRFLRDGERF